MAEPNRRFIAPEALDILSEERAEARLLLRLLLRRTVEVMKQSTDADDAKLGLLQSTLAEVKAFLDRTKRSTDDA